MRLSNLIPTVFFSVFILFFVSCNNIPSNSKDSNQTKSEELVPTNKVDHQIGDKPVEDVEVTLEPERETFQLTAKFVGFSLGDASHYEFEDENGKYWDFSGCDATNFTFEEALSESESNSDNQGWGSNKDLQGKWFDLTYYKREQPLYIDGPMATVEIISKVTLKK